MFDSGFYHAIMMLGMIGLIILMGDVSFSVGWCYEDGDIDIRRAMRIADENMYSDKKEYYKRVLGE